MNKTRRTFPSSLEREAVEQVLDGTPLRHAVQSFEITESLHGKWKRQFQEAGIEAFPGRGRQSGEVAELKLLRSELVRVTMERDVLKERSHLLAIHEVKFRAIQALPGQYPVGLMCQLFRVSRSGYYAWIHHRPSAREMANRQLLLEIRLMHAEVNGIYGHRRIHAKLRAQGFTCGWHRQVDAAQRHQGQNQQALETRQRRPASSSRHTESATTAVCCRQSQSALGIRYDPYPGWRKVTVLGGRTGLVLEGRRGLGYASSNAARAGKCGFNDGRGASQAFRRGGSAF